ncbi:MAG: hypothetical protein IPK26_15875 [Planctomycetes bacterium]|nr:hypothetical protein [Planctomycetota bacterium]
MRTTIASLLCCLLGTVPLPSQDESDWAGTLQLAWKKLRKGELTSAESGFQELLDAWEEEQGADRPERDLVDQAHTGLLEIELRRGNFDEVVSGIAALPEASRSQTAFSHLRARALQAVGRYDDAVAELRACVARDGNDFEARYRLGDALTEGGQRAAGRTEWEAAAALEPPPDGLQLAFLARCIWRLGGRANIESSSRMLVEAMRLVPDRHEPRTTYGLLKFEAYGEAAGHPSGEKDLARVLDAHGDVEEALLAMYRIRSANMQLDPGKTDRFLERVLQLNPQSVPALIERGKTVLDDRRYGDAAEILDRALRINGNHRIALAHRAAAAWLLHDQKAYLQFRTRALAGDGSWPEVDRILGDHLVALYRFGDALPFYEEARRVQPEHLPTLHGMARAFIYVGEGHKAKELLQRAADLSKGLVDPWRNNSLAVQQLLDDEYTLVSNDKFALQLHRDDTEVLREYLMPVHLQALEELGHKYDWRPERQVKVEVFHTWDDFSVRTIGFRGFTALGACFGPFITLVSPVDADVRKQDFMWEATVWHEYTHVLTLGLSRHRVPRWLTEGFSVYEERVRDPAWERGMDRELFDAFANQDIPPIRLMNRLFRGPRILFGYYQGGLIVELLARDFGFDKAIALLRAFGEDLDTDAAFAQALGMSSAAFDRLLLDFIEKEKLRGMRLVPRFDDAALQRLELKLVADATNTQARVDLAWACIQRGNPVDAGRHLAEVMRKDAEHGPALLARAALLAARKATDEAIAAWQLGFQRGADDFDSRIACGRALLARGEEAAAEDMFQKAKACWPKCTEVENAPEILLARLYRDQGRTDQAQMEMKAYVRRSGRAFTPRWTLAEFERDNGNTKAEAQYLTECNRIDPFQRELHERLGEALLRLGQKVEAALEFEVAAAVPPALDRKYLREPGAAPAADAPAERAERGALWLRAAELRHELGDRERANALLGRVQKDAAGTDAATTAARLQREWQGR